MMKGFNSILVEDRKGNVYDILVNTEAVPTCDLKRRLEETYAMLRDSTRPMLHELNMGTMVLTLK